MTNFMKRAADAVVDKLLELMQRDRAAQEAKPKSAESPLIVIPIPKWRTYFALAFITVFFLGLVCRAVWLQAVTTDFLQDQGEARYARTLTIAGERGEILDRNGVVLAASQPVRSIWADPAFAKKLSADDFKKLADVLQMKPKEVRDKIFKAKSKNFTYLARTQDVRTAEAVRLLKLPGIGVSPEVLREYPDGPAVAHVVGFTGRSDHGQEGIELARDKDLTGVPGARRVIRDARGRIIDDIWQKEAVPGHDVVLSIDSRVQFLAFQALKAQVEKSEALAGAAVVADVQTGEIIALVNVPSYDPNDRSTMLFEQMRNRVLTDQFEPGSTLKPFAIAKALDMGIVGPKTTIQTAPGKLTIGDRTIGDTHDYGLLTVSEIVAKSSNIGTVKIALEMSPQTLWDMYDEGKKKLKTFKQDSDKLAAMKAVKKDKDVKEKYETFEQDRAKYERYMNDLAQTMPALMKMTHTCTKLPKFDSADMSSYYRDLSKALESCAADAGDLAKVPIKSYAEYGADMQESVSKKKDIVDQMADLNLNDIEYGSADYEKLQDLHAKMSDIDSPTLDQSDLQKAAKEADLSGSLKDLETTLSEKIK